MKSSTDLYIEEIHRIPLLTVEQEQELGYRIKNGDISAVNEMVEHNLRPVIPIARLYLNRGIDFGDLIQYENLGLITAAERYNIDKKTKFLTYAVPWVKKNINMALERKSRCIRLPNEVYRTVQKYNVQKEKLEILKGHPLSIEQLQKQLNLTIDKIKEYERLSQDTVSLNTKIETENYDGEDSLEDIIYDDHLIKDEIIDKFRDEEILQLINEIIDNPRNVEITIKKYNKLLTGEELAEEYGLSYGGISKIIRENIKKIIDFPDYAYDEKK